MQKFNLLGHPEKLVRDPAIRGGKPDKKVASQFGKEYFDGDRTTGYGGYTYDGRWVAVAERLIDRYSLADGMKYLDVGCAKGFLMHDLKTLLPDLCVYGVDISSYAKEQAPELVKNEITIADCVHLPFPDNYFDVSSAINTIHNLEICECATAIRELIRVTKKKENIFIQVDAYTSPDELAIFEEWVLTAKTYMTDIEWIEFLKKLDFEGDYFWTIIGSKS